MAPVTEIDVPLLVEADCGACAERLREGLAEHKGVVDVVPRADGRTLGIRYDPDLCSLDCVSEAADELRVGLSRRFTHEVERVEGMDCYDCAQTIERAVARMPGVTQVSVNFPAARLLVEYEPDSVGFDQVARRVEGLGYRIVRDGGAPDARAGRMGLSRREFPTAASAALLLIGLLLDLVLGLGWPATAVYAASIAVGGLPISRAGLAALRATARPDINLLMSIAVVGAAAIGAWVEASLVVVLFSVGSALEGRAVERARRELAGLVALAPDTARVRRRHTRGGGEVHEEETEVPVSQLTVGDVLVIRPGERVPADGEVLEGQSSVDQAPLTGESTPVDKAPGDPLFAGSLNVQGLLVATVTTEPGDTAIEKIGRLVAEAQSRKSPSERWVDSFARFYTPIVIMVAALVALVPLAFGVGAHDSVYAALALLILACPCALVISTPVAIVSALGRASAAGVLVKGGAHLEAAARIRTVAFDKTGTLTLGRPSVRRVVALDGDEDGLLRLTASLEQGSEHPLARAIVAEAERRGLALQPVADFEALRGLGARARIGADVVEIGNGRLFGAERLAGAAVILDELRDSGQTAVVVARGERVVGLLGLADELRPEAAAAIADLGRLGIQRTVLLTGDNERTALAVAASTGVSETRFELLPDEKATIVGELGQGTAMVGDGVNDAPALAIADVGLAMGSAGSDAAIEVADVALMGDDPRKVAGLIGLARWSRAIVAQNIAFALGTKLIAVGFLAAGALPLWAAVASDVGASLIVVANGLRLVGGTPRGALRRAPMLPSARRAPRLANPPVQEHAAVSAPPQEGPGCECCAPDLITAADGLGAGDRDDG